MSMATSVVLYATISQVSVSPRIGRPPKSNQNITGQVTSIECWPMAGGTGRPLSLVPVTVNVFTSGETSAFTDGSTRFSATACSPGPSTPFVPGQVKSSSPTGTPYCANTSSATLVVVNVWLLELFLSVAR